jgi:hypothetical protein
MKTHSMLVLIRIASSSSLALIEKKSMQNNNLIVENTLQTVVSTAIITA